MEGKRQIRHATAVAIALTVAIVYFLSVSACIMLFEDNSRKSFTAVDNSYGSDSSVTETVSSDGGQSSFSQSSGYSENSGLESSDTASVTPSLPSSDIGSTSSDTYISDTSSAESKSDTVSSAVGNTSSADTPVVSKSGFTSAVWLSYGTDLNFKKDSSFSAFKSRIDSMFDNVKELGCDAVICQVRPFADAYYYSDYFPMSAYLSGTQGKDVGYDPMEYMITAAHSRGLQFHAWLNPYRISSSSTDVNTLSEKNPARKWLTDSDTSNDRYVLKYGNGLYFNPSVPEVQRLIIDGVREIVERYDVDGVHFDDYFYPFTGTPNDDFDKAEYLASKSSLSLDDWRRANVNTLISGVYRAVKSINSEVVFGISPAYNISKNKTDSNYNIKYADIAKWISTDGYIDYIAPQLYFGFMYPKANIRYDYLLDLWLSMPRSKNVKIYIGLAAYKIGTVDAGTDEWQTETDILAEQTVLAFEKKCDGVFIFNYSTFFADNELAQKQKTNMQSVLSIIKDGNK